MSESLSHEEFERLVDAIAQRCVDKMQPIVQEQIKKFTDMKVELLTGIDCNDIQARARMRQTVEFGHEARDWFHSIEGKTTIDAMRDLAGMIATPEGTAKLAALERLGQTLTTKEGADRFGALERFAETLTATESWARSRVMQAAIIGAIGVAAAGAFGLEPLKHIAKFLSGGGAGAQ
jgi:hypothetical protein